ncbi:ArsR family transcriptional regulator [Nakamurella silvestris]|nr:ArsR family transcriptional regulator [Nakamurella silvestris]
MSNLSSDAMFDALGDPVRRLILRELRHGPLPVGRLADQLPVGRPAASKHLKVLQGAGLVEHRSSGTKNLYSLAPAGLVPLQQWLVETWDDTLTRFADFVNSEGAADVPRPDRVPRGTPSAAEGHQP